MKTELNHVRAKKRVFSLLSSKMQTSTRPALYDYLTRIIGVLASEDQPEPEERNLMLSNVWAEIAGGMMDLALDKESSPLLETLILYSDCGHLTSFTNVLQKERRGSVAFLDLILNPFGSYVAGMRCISEFC